MAKEDNVTIKVRRGQKSYYKKLRKPSEQIWPNVDMCLKTISIEEDLMASIDAFKPTLRERFVLDRKASQGITGGWLCAVGIKYGDSGAITIPQNLSDKQSCNISAELPADQWTELERIQYLHTTPYLRMPIRAVFQSYVRLGLYACSSVNQTATG